MPLLATNPKAKFDYQILETYEAGLVLSGQETKATKQKKISLKGSYVVIRDNEAWLLNATISPYQNNTSDDYKPTRTRKLLLHKKEIESLIGKSKQKGLTLVPLRVYTKHNKIKLEFGLARGKRQYDKRDTIKERESKRKIQRALRIKE